MGANGSGKTTLLKILEGTLAPDEGTIRRADAVRIVTFAQDRTAHLDLATSLRRTLCPEGDSVIYRGRPVHVAGWAKRFLFREDQLEMPVESLSGGERARVLIARLMLQTADVLLLDEPTNDLDIPTLEVLEESLLEFSGALVLVSHDRHLLDRVSTMVIGLDDGGQAGIFADYSQWEAARDEQPVEKAAVKDRALPAKPNKKKLSYLEQREWDAHGRENSRSGRGAGGLAQCSPGSRLGSQPAAGCLREAAGGPSASRGALRALGGTGS